jgi:NADH:ubiquinone oxidoreductase subunit F (NADH-binding)
MFAADSRYMTVGLRPEAAAAPASSRRGWLRLDAGERLDYADHVALHATMPQLGPDELLAELELAGLTGRGGAGFPVHRKMQAVRSGAGPRVVVANAAEGEPASAKDKTLLATNPHLTLDGLQLAAGAVAADEAYLYVHGEPGMLALVQHAVRERRVAGADAVPVQVVAAPARFVAGEESAVASRVSGGPALPRSKPPRVFESGVHGRPTLVQNAETLAHVALIARHGAAAFRAAGHPSQPGTMLFSLSGAVHRPGVLEAPTGITIGALLSAAGGPSHHVGAVLLGGYHGGWLAWPQAREMQLCNDALRPHGLSVGAGVVVVLPADVCGVVETSRVLDYLAAESAGQCGPCVFGMPRLADTYRELAGGARGRRRSRRLTELGTALERRGGCAHPDGSLRFLRSAQTVFAAELDQHARGRCSAVSTRRILPTPGTHPPR